MTADTATNAASPKPGTTIDHGPLRTNTTNTTHQRIEVQQGQHHRPRPNHRHSNHIPQRKRRGTNTTRFRS